MKHFQLFKNASYQRAFLCLYFLVYSLYTTAQSGSTCISATSFSAPQNGIPIAEIQTTQSQWFSFVASNNHVKIIIDEIASNSGNKLESVSLYSGTCAGLSLMITDTALSGTDSVFVLNATGLINGATYFVCINKFAGANAAAKYFSVLDFLDSPACIGCHDLVANSCNLVCNGDFEYNNGVYPSIDGQPDLACPWERASDDGSSDYFHVLAYSPMVSLPANFTGNQLARSGSAYTGFYAYVDSAGYPNYHEYLKQSLKCQLMPGATYELTFYVSLAGRSNFSTSSLGAVFLNNSVTFPFPGAGQFVIPAGVATVMNTTGFVTDTTGWTAITGTFVAHGDETQILIGDFGSSNPSNIDLTYPGAIPISSYIHSAYYYLDDVSLTPINTLAINATDTSVCPYEQIIFGSNLSGAILDWTPAAAMDATPSESPIGSFPVSTDVTGTITYCTGCTFTDTIHINVATAIANAGPDVIICKGPYGTDLTATGGGTYLWSTGATTATIHVNPLTTTTYTVTVTDSEGCSLTGTDAVTVFVADPVTTATASPAVIPPGCSSTLSASCTIAGLPFTWYPGALSGPTVVVSPSTTTSYIVATDASVGSGCFSSDTITVTVVPIPFTISGSTSACAGLSPYSIVSSITSGVTYTWSTSTGLSGTGTVANVDFNLTGGGSITFIGTYALGCTYSSTMIVAPCCPTFTVTGNTSACAGMSTYSIGTPAPGATYTWSTSTGLSGTGTSANVNFGLTGGGTITFTGTYIGCSYSSSLYVGSCCSVVSAIPTLYNTNTSALIPYGTMPFGVLTVTNQTFAINGTFAVNQNLTLRGCDLRMGYNAKIIIGHGVTLKITSNGIADKTHIYACDEMWDGIYVPDAAELLIIDNGTTIEDALNAVVSDNAGNFQISSNAVWGNVIFNKNYKSIVVNNTSGTHPGYLRTTTIQCYDGVVGGNPVNTSNKLHYPHATQRSDVGIEITNVGDITVGNPSIPSYTNIFDNLDFGVRGNNSGVSIFNNTFQNMTAAGPPDAKKECNPGTAVCVTGNPSVAVPNQVRVGNSTGAFHKNTFSNCQMGVVANQNLTLRVWRNTFTNMGATGVRAARNYQRDIIINENTINNARLGVDCYDNKSSNITVDNNDIDAGTVAQAGGVLAQEIVSSTATYAISRNTIHNVRTGVAGSGLKNSAIFRNNVYLKHTTTAGQYCRGIRLQGSNLCTITGNWVMGQNTTDYWIEGISVDVSYSDVVTCNETHNVFTGMFFGGVQTPNTQIAKNEMNNDYQGLVLNFGEVGPQLTVVSGVNKPNDNKWTGTHTLHTLSYNSSGGLSPFYVRTATGQYNPSPYLQSSFPSAVNFVPLNPISGNLNSLVCPLIVGPVGGGVPPHLPLLLDIANDAITPPAFNAPTRWMLKQSLYQYLKTDPALTTTQPLLASFQSYQTANNLGKLDDVENVLGNPATQTSSLLATSKTTNVSVVAANDAEINSKWLNDVLLDNAISGSEFTTSQLADLRILAAKCPYNDGVAVYQARTILSQVENVEYMNECEVVQPQYQRGMLTQQSNENDGALFKLYPNPNDGTMNLIYSLEENSKGELILYDVTGKLVAKYFLQIGKNNQLFIQENELNNGVYFYKVIIDNELKLSDKIVIIK